MSKSECKHSNCKNCSKVAANSNCDKKTQCDKKTCEK